MVTGEIGYGQSDCVVTVFGEIVYGQSDSVVTEFDW